MPESLYGILPQIAAAAFMIIGLIAAMGRISSRAGWKLAATACAVFALWTGWSIVAEGPWAFWREHVRGAWANQIWFDLLLAALIAVSLLAPRARAVGMSPVRWFLLVACTGSIGLLAMLARCLFLETRRGVPSPSSP